MVPASRETAEIQKMKNSGNEAKKYLKTKDITFFSAANYARFACKSAPIRAPKEQQNHFSRRTSRSSRAAIRGSEVTLSRLHEGLAFPHDGSLPGGNLP